MEVKFTSRPQVEWERTYGTIQSSGKRLHLRFRIDMKVETVTATDNCVNGQQLFGVGLVKSEAADRR